jgi:hypothetical protein
MGKVIYREFLGSKPLVFCMCLTGIGIPLAVIYVLEWLVTIEEEVADPTAFLEMHRRKRA